MYLQPIIYFPVKQKNLLKVQNAGTAIANSYLSTEQ